MTDIDCYRCGRTLDAKTDEWWSHNWREQPAEEAVEKAIELEKEGREMRDWFTENVVLCSDCHKIVVGVINKYE